MKQKRENCQSRSQLSTVLNLTGLSISSLLVSLALFSAYRLLGCLQLPAYLLFPMLLHVDRRRCKRTELVHWHGPLLPLSHQDGTKFLLHVRINKVAIVSCIWTLLSFHDSCTIPWVNQDPKSNKKDPGFSHTHCFSLNSWSTHWAPLTSISLQKEGETVHNVTIYAGQLWASQMVEAGTTCWRGIQR